MKPNIIEMMAAALIFLSKEILPDALDQPKCYIYCLVSYFYLIVYKIRFVLFVHDNEFRYMYINQLLRLK